MLPSHARILCAAALRSLFLLFLLPFGRLTAQSESVQVAGSQVLSDPPNNLTDSFLGAAQYVRPVTDSVLQLSSRMRLLPERLGLFESTFWGEHGLMRDVGLAPLTVEGRKNELSLRRTMLTVHQLGGFVTLGLFIPTLVYGQRNLQNWNDAEAGLHPLNRSLNSTHQAWAQAAWFAYMTTASMSLLSPPPLLRREQEGTVGIHRTLAWVHFLGMVAIPILGQWAHSEDRSGSPTAARTLRTVHQVTAYVSVAAFTASLVVITF